MEWNEVGWVERYLFCNYKGPFVLHLRLGVLETICGAKIQWIYPIDILLTAL